MKERKGDPVEGLAARLVDSPQGLTYRATLCGATLTTTCSVVTGDGYPWVARSEKV